MLSALPVATPASPPLVLHLLPVALARGAQHYARELTALLDGSRQSHRIATLFGDVGVASDDGHATLGVSPTPWRRFGFDPRVVLRLRRLLAAWNPAVVVAHGSEPLKYAAASVPTSTAVIYYKIGLVRDGMRPLHRALHRRLAARAAVVAGVSQDCLDEAHALLDVPRERLRLVPNGRDPAVYRPRPQARRAGRPHLVFVGHLTAGKRPRRFVDVVQALRSRGCDVDATLVGDGPLLDQMRACGASVGIDVTGRRDDVPAILAGADVLVFTSVAAGEGMPGVLIEAGLSGLPVVTTRVPGAATVIDDGVTGFVVAIDDFDALVERVACLVDDPVRRRTMGAAAAQRCRGRFTIAASADRWRDVLAPLLEPVTR